MMSSRTLVVLICVIQVSSISIVRIHHGLKCEGDYPNSHVPVENARWTKDNNAFPPEGNDTRIVLSENGSKITFNPELPSDEGFYVCTDPDTGEKATHALGNGKHGVGL